MTISRAHKQHAFLAHVKSATCRVSQASRKALLCTPRSKAPVPTEAQEGDVVELSIGICVYSSFIVPISPMDTPRFRETGKHDPVKCLEGTWATGEESQRLPFFVSVAGWCETGYEC